jgi:hypothetical protein
MLDPYHVSNLIEQTGQILTLETYLNDRPVIDAEYGIISKPKAKVLKILGYVYSPSAKERPTFGATFLDGDVVGIISAVGVTKSSFTPNCILIADGRRYAVSYGAEIKNRSVVLFHRLHLTPEVRTQ